jgi:hypothetical protein
MFEQHKMQASGEDMPNVSNELLWFAASLVVNFNACQAAWLSVNVLTS